MAVELTRSMLWRTRASRAVIAITDAVTGWLLLSILIGASPGVAAFALQSPSAWATFLGTNRATLDQRADLFGRIGGSMLVIFAIYAWVIAYRTARGRPFSRTIKRLNTRSAFLLAP